MTRPTPRMSSSTRLILAVVLVVFLVGVSAVGAVAAAVYGAGTMRVEVVESDGERVSIMLPAAVAVAAIKLIPCRTVIREAGEDLEPYWPAIREACRELSRSPDAVFVQVEDRGTRVRIAKENGSFVVDVDDGGDRVRVVLPVRAVEALADKLEDAFAS